MGHDDLAQFKVFQAARGGFMIGVTPDYEIVVREDILHEEDGPMLVHGLQEVHGQQILLPSRKADRPSREALAWRYEKYLNL